MVCQDTSLAVSHDVAGVDRLLGKSQGYDKVALLDVVLELEVDLVLSTVEVQD